MHLRELHTQPGHLIRRAQQIAVALFMEECAAFELTPVQYAALVAIKEHPGIDATRLSALIAFDRSTLGNVLERLEARKLVERYASDEDKRIKLIKLTPAGAALNERAESAVLRAQERILKPLKPADRARFMSLLAQLVELNNEASRVPQRESSSPLIPAKAGTQR
jgi:MarR family transcriptional regulator, lower aerobic nicotinate degradation pathway regulator